MDNGSTLTGWDMDMHQEAWNTEGSCVRAMEGMGIAAGSLSEIKVQHLKGFASVPQFSAYES